MTRLLTIGLILLLPPFAAGQRGDPESEQLERLIKQAWKEMESGARGSSAGQKWAEVLWQYREQHQGTEAGARAAAQALHLLVHAGQIDDAIAKAHRLRADDPAWRQAMEFLVEAAGRRKDYSYVIQKGDALLRQSNDPVIRREAAFALGSAYWHSNRLEEARRAFERVIQEAPDSDRARQARGNIYELTQLQVGQPAPAFVAKSTGGAPISLSALKGKLVLLNFWASW